ncbi:hypothetical protein Hanom_Chr08g00750171 [Helianthus anomalus]
MGLSEFLAGEEDLVFFPARNSGEESKVREEVCRKDDKEIKCVFFLIYLKMVFGGIIFWVKSGN